ncbi:hypothetical protein MNEG_14244 [Monoraphidium neglectum]|uniref:Uncharacterized protein n=1 Tax=Monoraphidium neglectum TaxID=145388 RepID=A0A0D2KD59_9CHLO|nr:hypothetical protein MNEG_14244 [Monoraphidium neglectum]KIY93718.1 hypothetical protein MNEG_14244 [Monoraphidium neglectum]|eukprot:XP_013892738.1 hypothetical protein MNEG_14244 [Monoraphidium neglectum]
MRATRASLVVAMLILALVATASASAAPRKLLQYGGYNTYGGRNGYGSGYNGYGSGYNGYNGYGGNGGFGTSVFTPFTQVYSRPGATAVQVPGIVNVASNSRGGGVWTPWTGVISWGGRK